MAQSILIYFSAFIISIASAHQYQKKITEGTWKSTKTKPYLVCFFVFLTLFLPIFVGATRQGIGTDYTNYLIFYKMFSKYDLVEALNKPLHEPFYTIINIITNMVFGGQEWAIFLVTTGLTICLVFWILKHYENDLSIAVGLFVFYMSFYITSLNIIRQMLAVLIVLYSVKYIFKKEPVKYIVGVLIAAMFHNTALICLPFFILDFEQGSKQRIKKQTLYVIALTSPLWLYIVFMYFPNLPMFDKYLSNYDIVFNGYGIGFLLDMSFILLPVFLFRKDLLELNKKYDFFVNIALIGIPIRIIAYFQEFGSRLYLYISSFEILIIPLVFRATRDHKHALLIRIITVTMYVLYFVYTFVFNNSGEAFPYKSIF